MNTTLQASMLNTAQEKMLIQQNSSWKMNLFMLLKLPSAFFSGVRPVEVNPEYAKVSVPFKWFSQNPFRSTYFACLAMAAEMSTGLLGLLACEGHKPGVAMLVVNLEAEYHKKATGLTTFTFDDGAGMFAAVHQAIDTGEGVTYKATSIGRNNAGEEVAKFHVTWSFKQRSK